MIDCCIQKTEKNSLWPDCSLIEIKKKQKKTHTQKKKNSHWSDCYLLSILRIWLVNLKYTWSCCHCILSICLQVSTYLFDLFANLSLSKWKCYVIWHIQKNENCLDNCPSRLSGRMSCHYEKINTQSQWWTTFSMLFSRADLRESMVFYGRCLHGCFNCSFTYEFSAAV